MSETELVILVFCECLRPPVSEGYRTLSILEIRIACMMARLDHLVKAGVFDAALCSTISV
jgi:hypothetical protein